MGAVSPPHERGLADEGAAMMEAPRVYQVWRGSNVFFLKGRLIFGPDVRSLFLTIFLIAAPVSIFCVFVARKLMDKFPHHWGISIMVVTVAFTLYDLCLLLLTSGRDPGIIPRSIRPPEPESSDGSIDSLSVQTPQFHLPRMKDVVVNGITVKIKYCDTCMLYRPPRCSHCSICNNCVERFDHHCPWVGQCIGKRNYRFFYMFVFSTTLLCFYVFTFCWVYIMKIKDAEETNIWKAMGKTPASVVLILYTFLTAWFVGGLSVFHLYLISTNQTTYENFRYRYENNHNPYNLSMMANFKEIFFTKISPSNNFRARVPPFNDLQPQQSTGGFMSSNIDKVIGDIEMGTKVIAWGEDKSAESVDIEADFSSRAIDDKDNMLHDSAFLSEQVLFPGVSEWRAATKKPTHGLASDSVDDNSNVHGNVLQEIRSASRLDFGSTIDLTQHLSYPMCDSTRN